MKKTATTFGAPRALPAYVLLALACAQGCANLAAIREFGAISADTASYQRLLDDYVASPERQSRTILLARAADIDPRLPGKKRQEAIGAYIAALDKSAADEAGSELARKRALRAAQQERLLLRQTAIVEYMDALGQLAADDLVVYDKEIDDLAGAVKDNKFAGEADADAFAAVAKVLAKAATDAWRQRQLKKLIAETNQDFQGVVAALRKVVALAIARDDVRDELEAARKSYQTLIRTSSDAAGIAATEEWWQQRKAEIGERGRAAEAYVQVLDKIAAGHQKLYDERNHLCNKDTLQQIRVYAKDLRTLYKTLHKG